MLQRNPLFLVARCAWSCFGSSHSRSFSAFSHCVFQRNPSMQSTAIIRPHAQDCVCSFLTDVEGNFEYFTNFVNISKVLEWEDNSKTVLKLKDNAVFVYGGDSQDKGTGDIRFTELIVNLKLRYPDRVRLLIGNRDANKLRLSSELSTEAMRDPKVKTDLNFPYWIPKDKVVTPQAFLEANGLADSRANRLRWMLRETMGADGAFDRRRVELATLRGVGEADVPDDEVVESYMQEVSTDPAARNFMLRYLEQADLACLFGRTLFVHGAVTAENLGWVPGRDAPEPGPVAWAEALNAWARAQLADYRLRPAAGGNGRDRGGFGLVDYGAPGGNGGRTVVYASFLRDGNAAPLDPRVEEYLARDGITGVVSGHVPHGDCPTVIRSRAARVITADTSYSHVGHRSEAGWGVDNRGSAVSEVLLWADGRAMVHGRLRDGSALAYCLPPPGIPEGGEEDGLVGRELKDGHWVKARRHEQTGGAEYMVCRGEGQRLSTSWRTAAELAAADWA